MTDQLRAHLLKCLGGPWPQSPPLEARVEATTQCDGYRRETVSYVTEHGESVPAYVLVPEAVNAEAPAPGIIVFHQHHDEWHLGKSEPAGVAGDPVHHMGVDLVRRGYVVLCPDALAFEGRRHTALLGQRYEEFVAMRYLTAGRSLAWKNILDARRAVDYLQARADVRADSIGAYGHSMGATIAWLTGPWEPRLKAIVTNCCLPTYAAIEEHQLTHCYTTFVPRWGLYGDTPDIVGLIAPTPLLMNFGEHDSGSPLSGVRPGIDTIARAYREADASENFVAVIESGAGHTLTPDMAERAFAWFSTHLLR